MGQCYSVKLKIAFKNSEEGVVEVLRNKIMRHHYEKIGYSRFNIDEDNPPHDLDFLVMQFLPDEQIEKYYERGYICYNASFDCLYSWEGVIDSMFREMAPVLADNSYISVYPDEGNWKLTVKDGKIIES